MFSPTCTCICISKIIIIAVHIQKEKRWLFQPRFICALCILDDPVDHDNDCELNAVFSAHKQQSKYFGLTLKCPRGLPLMSSLALDRVILSGVRQSKIYKSLLGIKGLKEIVF